MGSVGAVDRVVRLIGVVVMVRVAGGFSLRSPLVLQNNGARKGAGVGLGSFSRVLGMELGIGSGMWGDPNGCGAALPQLVALLVGEMHGQRRDERS